MAYTHTREPRKGDHVDTYAPPYGYVAESIIEP